MNRAKKLLEEVKDEKTLLEVNGGHARGVAEYALDLWRDVGGDWVVDNLVHGAKPILTGLARLDEGFSGVSAWYPAGYQPSHTLPTHSGHSANNGWGTGSSKSGWCTYHH